MDCIFCDTLNEAQSIEHIVSESLGNKRYVMKKGEVCDVCNGRFSKFEDIALTKTVLVMERARFGVETKKGRNVKGSVKGIGITGDEDLRPTYLKLKGLNESNVQDYDHATGIGHVVIPSFDKSEVATSKLLLKMGLESIFTSQRTIFKKYDFTELKEFLTSKSNSGWPFMTSDFELEKFESVPKLLDKYFLGKINCRLSFLELDRECLLFKFKYGAIPLTINLLNRNLQWIKAILPRDKNAQLYPQRFNSKLEKI